MVRAQAVGRDAVSLMTLLTNRIARCGARLQARQQRCRLLRLAAEGCRSLYRAQPYRGSWGKGGRRHPRSRKSICYHALLACLKQQKLLDALTLLLSATIQVILEKCIDAFLVYPREA